MLELPDRCLAVFVDDTGHEEFAKGHQVYGLDGCAALGRDLECLIEGPWKESTEARCGLARSTASCQQVHKEPENRRCGGRG